ncbi:MAG: hypothetical protein QOF18_2168 [Frankiaceae bacterium]|nr:hypothetical protein [Frankiaceae bacterium]
MLARRPMLAGLLAATLTGGLTVALPVMAHSTSPRATFSRPLILAGGGAEPSIRVPADGKSAAYVSAPTGLGSNFWRITKKHNPDGSVTFRQGPVMQPDLGTGGGDSEISVGDLTQNTPANGCAPIAYSGLHNIDLLDNFTVATSTDCGKSFALANLFGTENTLTDRQWQVFDGAKTNFLIYHLVSTGQIVVSESPDAGQHYVSLGASNANGFIEPQLLAASGTNQQIGNIIVSHAEPIKGVTNALSGEPVHAMYAIFGIAEDTQQALQSQAPGGDYNGLNAIYVGKSIDGGVTWTDSKVFSVDPSTKRELNMLFPVVTADSAGNLYAAWSDTYKIEYAVSTDHGAHWSKPHQVNLDNRRMAKNGVDIPDAGKADVFPWIAAGGRGLLDVVWYHGEGGAPASNRIYRDPGDSKTKWTVAFAQLGGANHTSRGAAAPSVLTYNEAITPVIHIGDICQNGTLCDLGVDNPVAPRKDRSLLDFFQVAIDREGRAHLAIADNAAAPGQLISAYTSQLTGVSLTTGRKLKPLKVKYDKLACAPDATFTDKSDDATEIVVTTPLPSEPALDVVRSYLTWNAPGKLLTFHVRVKDLSKDPPTGATGEALDYAFGIGGKGYDLFGSHDQGIDSADIESPTRTGVSNDVKFTVDKAHNEFTFTLPHDALAKITDKKAQGPVIGPSSTITGLSITTRRSEGGHFLPNADEAAGVCPFVVPKHGSIAQGVGPTGGSGDNPGLLPAAPRLGASSTVLRESLPGALLALLVGACAVAWTGRRRDGLALA